MTQRKRLIDIAEVLKTFRASLKMIEFARETLLAFVTVESVPIADLHRRLLAELTDEKVHGDVFTVHRRLHVIADLFGHDVSVELVIPAMEKSRAR